MTLLVASHSSRCSRFAALAWRHLARSSGVEAAGLWPATLAIAGSDVFSANAFLSLPGHQ